LNRTEKQDFVNELAKGVQEAQAIALMSFSKLTVEEMTSFRLALRKKDVRVKVVKNTLAKRVFNDTPFKEVCNQFEGPTLLAYSKGDAVLTAKAIMEWANKENFNVKLKAGVALNKVISQKEMVALSKLPGRNDLLVGFLWALKSHPTRFLYALQDGPNRLGYALGALKAKKEKESN
jgi:large subunit ribosomal protein L10